MSRNLYNLMGADEPSGEDRDDWVVGVEGIVAINDDPENQHRVKVLIPSIDENMIWDKWCRPMICYVGPPHYGSFHVPDIGGEVILFGRLGQKHHLLYGVPYNEDYDTPADFHGDTTDVVGFRAPCDAKHVAEGDRYNRSGGLQFEVEGAGKIGCAGGVWINDKQFETAVPIPGAKHPDVSLPTIRSQPAVPHVGCIPGEAISYVGEQFGNAPDQLAIALIKAVVKCLSEDILILQEGAAADAELTTVYTAHANRLIGEVADLNAYKATLIARVTEETNRDIAFVNAKAAAVASALAPLTAIPSGQRSKAQQLLITRYGRYASELSAQAAHLATTISCLSG